MTKRSKSVHPIARVVFISGDNWLYAVILSVMFFYGDCKICVMVWEIFVPERRFHSVVECKESKWLLMSRNARIFGIQYVWWCWSKWRSVKMTWTKPVLCIWSASLETHTHTLCSWLQCDQLDFMFHWHRMEAREDNSDGWTRSLCQYVVTCSELRKMIFIIWLATIYCLPTKLTVSSETSWPICTLKTQLSSALGWRNSLDDRISS